MCSRQRWGLSTFNSLLALIVTLVVASPATLSAQWSGWSYDLPEVERHPMTDEIIRTSSAKASAHYKVYDRGTYHYVGVEVSCVGRKVWVGIEFVLFDRGPHSLDAKSGDQLHVRWRFDEHPTTEWQRDWQFSGNVAKKMFESDSELVSNLRNSSRLRLELFNSSTGKRLMLDDGLRGSNAAIARLKCAEITEAQRAQRRDKVRSRRDLETVLGMSLAEARYLSIQHLLQLTDPEGLLNHERYEIGSNSASLVVYSSTDTWTGTSCEVREGAYEMTHSAWKSRHARARTLVVRDSLTGTSLQEALGDCD